MNIQEEDVVKSACYTCAVVFTSEEMVNHRRSVHNIAEYDDVSDSDDEYPSVYVCNYCTYTCERASGMRIHYDKDHDDEFRTRTKLSVVYKYRCKSCPYSSNSIYNYRIHKQHHKGENPFRCDACTYGCTRLANLTMHKKMCVKDVQHTGMKR